MTYQSKWLRVFGSMKLALASIAAAGLVAFAIPAHAVTYIDGGSNEPVDININVGSFGVGDNLISSRTWDASFGGDVLDITYTFTANGDSWTDSTATALNPDPTIEGQENFGIANLILTWADGTGTLSSEQFTDANGVLDTSLVLTQILTHTKVFTLNLTGTLLSGGGGFIARVEAIPLPAGLLLFLSGLAGIGFLGRYKARRQEPVAA